MITRTTRQLSRSLNVASLGSRTSPLPASLSHTGVFAIKTTSGISNRQFSSTKMATFSTPSSDRPKNEMAYFPDMTTALPSQSGEFRRVMWTGLYSQLVLMTVPVGGDIGDEVCQFLSRLNTTQPRGHLTVAWSALSSSRFHSSTE